jgi:transketolase
MREELCEALLNRSKSKEFIFLTGDLGYNALEPLQKSLGDRFINAGISEQNMVSVAAALARKNFEVWVYSIAPFLYARAYEQIRNDIVFHDLPVNLIGNGGGYGYGVMGPTHHAIEDYGSLLNFESFEAYIPAAAKDIDVVIALAGASPNPTYVRLGKSEFSSENMISEFSAWRSLTVGKGPVILSVGPLSGLYVSEFMRMETKDRPNLWVISKLPIVQNGVPKELLNQIRKSGKLVIVEEHVKNSGIGFSVLSILNKNQLGSIEIVHLSATKHVYSTYGSQEFLRGKSRLDLEGVLSSMGFSND